MRSRLVAGKTPQEVEEQPLPNVRCPLTFRAFAARKVCRRAAPVVSSPGASIAMTGDVSLRVGDVVRLSGPGLIKSKYPNRPGVVVSLAKTRTQVRVQWHGLKRPMAIHRSLLVLADGGEPPG
jgi:hypothetical protein